MANALQRLHRPDLARKLIEEPRPATHRRPRVEEMTLDEERREQLRAYVAPDMARLRTMVGPDQ